MKVYVKKPVIQGAWKWIQRGYYLAWEELGYEVEYYDSIQEAKGSEYQLMAREWDIKSPADLEVIENASRAYLFVQPDTFPEPWVRHPNFRSSASPEVIETLNDMDNVYLWTFADVDPKYYNQWKKVHTIPLAYDSIGYKHVPDEKYKKFDISFVGGWANNGFNEKRKIMIDIFSKFMDSGLHCGFFVNKNLTHEQECKVLHNSRVTLNVHDAYQRILGLDTNERTFKSLGLNGCLVSDTVGQLNRLFPQLKTSLEADELVQITKDYLSLTEVELNDIKEHNRQMVMDNHCYTHRVKSLLKL
jgi:spore maturation protein CgeB